MIQTLRNRLASWLVTAADRIHSTEALGDSCGFDPDEDQQLDAADSEYEGTE